MTTGYLYKIVYMYPVFTERDFWVFTSWTLGRRDIIGESPLLTHPVAEYIPLFITFLSLILSMNNFAFHCKHYLQTKGCAMGTIGVPFMVNFEAKHIIYPYIKEMSLMDLRYFDGIYMLWKGAKAGLMIFIKELNEKHKFIKFDFQILPRKTVIFDTMLYKDRNKIIYITNLQINKHSYTLNQNEGSLKSV